MSRAGVLTAIVVMGLAGAGTLYLVVLLMAKVFAD